MDDYESEVEDEFKDDDDEILEDAKEDFKACVEAEADMRKAALDDLEFARLGKQWPDEIESKRREEGRPCLTINRLPAFIKQVTNDARQSRPSIVTKPVGEGSDVETSQVLNDLIRNIETVSSADIAYDTALDFAVTCGIGYIIVRNDYATDDSFDTDIKIDRVSNPMAVYGDYASKSATSDDWNLAFVTELYSEERFKSRWPKAQKTCESWEANDTDDDSGLWFAEKTIRVAEYWRRKEVPVKLLKLSDGSVMKEPEYVKIADLAQVQGVSVVSERVTMTYRVVQYIVTGSEVLEKNEWPGKYIPIIPVYGDEININGKRHFQSLVRFAKDPQRMFNFWRTASTELVALAPKAPFIGASGAFATDAGKWQSANTQSHAYIEYDPVPGEPPPQRQPFAGVPAGALQEALNASDDMKNIMGLHDASLGARSNETSGKAIMARQREGDISTFNFVDNRNRAIEHLGRIVVDLIPKVYTVPRIMRCIKEDGTAYQVPINQPAAPVPGPEGVQQYQPMPQHIEGVTKVFDLTAGKYDVSVQAGPSYTSKRAESADQMMEFIRVFPQAAPLIGDLLAKNLDWPGSKEVSDRLKNMLPPQAVGQQNPAIGQLQQQLQQQDGQARQAIVQLQQQLQQANAQLAQKQQEMMMKERELAIKAQEAETERIKTLGEIDQKEKDRQAKIMGEYAQAQANALAQQSHHVTPMN